MNIPDDRCKMMSLLDNPWKLNNVSINGWELSLCILLSMRNNEVLDSIDYKPLELQMSSPHGCVNIFLTNELFLNMILLTPHQIKHWHNGFVTPNKCKWRSWELSVVPFFGVTSRYNVNNATEPLPSQFFIGRK